MQARKERKAKQRELLRGQRRDQRELERQEQERERAEEYTRSMRIRHDFAKVAGVIFRNDDGSERQKLISKCKRGEPLSFLHDRENEFSIFATKVLRKTGEQLGYAPEYMAERIVDEVESGYKARGVLLNVTGGTFEKPTYGANFAVVFHTPEVSDSEYQTYATDVIASQWDT